MSVLVTVVTVLVVLAVMVLAASLRQVQQYQRGVVLRFGRLLPGVRQPGLRLLIPFVDQMRRISVQTSHRDHGHGMDTAHTHPPLP